jgi:hypothetical protein
MKNKSYMLTYFIILLTGVMHLSVQAQLKNGTHRANFSGVWKAKESISMGGNIFCSYDAKDRMVAKTMKIVEQADYLTIENSDSDAGSAKSREKLIFDGKTGQINLSKENRKTFARPVDDDRKRHSYLFLVTVLTLKAEKMPFVRV